MEHPFIQKLRDFLKEHDASIDFFIEGDTHSTIDVLEIYVQKKVVFKKEGCNSTDDI